MRGLALLKQRRFGPYFMTQALGAFNDNVFRNALMFMLTFRAVDALNVDINIVMNLAAGLFILPFFLMSGWAGQLADKYEKSRLVRHIKALEVLIMLLAALAFVTEFWWGLIALVGVMGAQSALFGPVKYALLPQHLAEDELVSGNAWVGMGTFVAILLGTIAGGLLSAQPTYWAALCVLMIALAGRLAAQGVPHAPASDPALTIDWNPITQTRKVLAASKQDAGVFWAIMAISWFWFLGIGYLTQFPNFTREVLAANQTVGTLLLTLFSLGVATGAMLCDRWSRGRIELGMVPLGALGVALCGYGLYAMAEAIAAEPAPELARTLADFWSIIEARWLMLWLALSGIAGGLFIVPLYSYVQRHTPETRRAQVIAALNVLNSLFMVVSTAIGILLLSVLQLSLPQFYLIFALTAVPVLLASVRRLRDPFLRFLAFLISHGIYRVRHHGLSHIPDTGPALVVANHVSYMDAVLLMGACQRPLRFIIDKEIHDTPALKWLFEMCGTVPISSERVDRRNFQEAFSRVAEALDQGELVFIFPEGRLTPDGEIQTFRRGVERIIKTSPVPVIPMALSGLWGSWFSRERGRAFAKAPRRLWSRVDVNVGAPVPPDQVSAAELEARVRALRGARA